MKGLNEQEIKNKNETKALRVIKAIPGFVGHTFPCFCSFTPPHPISES